MFNQRIIELLDESILGVKTSIDKIDFTGSFASINTKHALEGLATTVELIRNGLKEMNNADR